MKNENRCCACGIQANHSYTNDIFAVRCPRCGDYRVTGTARAVIGANGLLGSAASSAIFESPGILITTENLPSIRSARAPTVMRRAERLLRYLATSFPGPGQVFSLPWKGQDAIVSQAEGGLPMNGNALVLTRFLAPSWSENTGQLGYLLCRVLADELGWLDKKDDLLFSISPRGWVHLQSSERAANSKVGFIAMSFNATLVRFSKEVLEPAIEATKHEPLRMDQKEHANRIDDEIIATIRTARFAVCDFTEHKAGVYFEAGLAMGFGLPVIWVCQKEDMKIGISTPGSSTRLTGHGTTCPMPSGGWKLESAPLLGIIKVQPSPHPPHATVERVLHQKGWCENHDLKLGPS